MTIRYIALGLEKTLQENGVCQDGYESNKPICIIERNARFISNYTSKAVRKLKLETDGTFKMISVALNLHEETSKIVSIDCLKQKVIVSMDELKAYKQTTDLVERYEYYLSWLEKGYRLAANFKNIQVNALLSMHQQFRMGGYKNEWLFKKKPIHEYGIYIYLKCYFTTFDFRLELEVYDLKSKEFLTQGVVLQTSPYEVCYERDFKQISIADGKLLILDFLEHPCYSFDLKMLSKGMFNVEYLNNSNVHFEEFRKEIAQLTW